MSADMQTPERLAAIENSFRERQNSLQTQNRGNGVKPRACNNCRQQKLRCDLTKLGTPSSTTCSRCQRLRLDCRVDDTFKRIRKRKKSGDLEEEIHKLKHQLSIYEGTAVADWTSALATDPTAPFHIETDGLQNGNLTRANEESRKSLDPLHRILSTTVPGGISPDSPDESTLPGATTLPKSIFLSGTPARRVETSSSRQLRDIELSKDEINDLFRVYFSDYHDFLPFLDPGTSPDQYYDQSPLLFWSIISIASRRYLSNPTLLTRLARTLTDTIWKSLQTVPHSLAVVQSLLLVCTWPFPTSSSSTDPSYMLSGMIMQLSVQMGLHRPKSPEDFTKVHLSLSLEEAANRQRTWIAGNVVIQSVSCGVGFPAPAQLRDWSVVACSPEGPWLHGNLHAHLKCASMCSRVSQALASNSLDYTRLLQARERLPLYTILNHEIVDLENSRSWTPATIAFHLCLTKLHLHAFYLFDEASTAGYVERIVALYSTASSLIEHVQTLDICSPDFLHHCPFFCYEGFLCAAFIVLRILKNVYFAAIVDANLGKKLINFSVSALRKMSVANNDLPGRLSDVLAYLWTHPDPSIASGSGIDGLQLKVKSRMSMSIVYDSLWRWREQFRAEVKSTESQDLHDDAPLTTHDNQTFDMTLDLADLNGIYSDNLQLDWLI